jgi:hypothetical protein
LHKLIWILTPQACRELDDRLTGGVVIAYTARLSHYLWYEKHPVILVRASTYIRLLLASYIVQIFFLSLLTGSIGVFLFAAWSLLSSGHHFAIVLIVPTPYIFTYLSVYSTASIITPKTHAQHMQTYPYDHILYHPGRQCRTCLHVKPPRSKHCSICKVCIARFDHHCVWINNCVTEDNLRWFLSLVFSLVVVLLYGSYLAYILLRHELLSTPDSQSFINRLSIALARNPAIGSVGLLAAMAAPLPIGLLSYHIYLIWAGTTTNETAKWGDLREDMADGVVWKGERSGVYNLMPERTVLEVATSWPIKANQVIVRTSDGQMPRWRGERLSSQASSQWTKCWTLAEVENVYDLGFADNIRDALKLSIES